MGIVAVPAGTARAVVFVEFTLEKTLKVMECGAVAVLQPSHAP